MTINTIEAVVAGIAGVVILIAILAMFIRRIKAKSDAMHTVQWPHNSSMLEVLQYSDSNPSGNLDEGFECVPLDDICGSEDIGVYSRTAPRISPHQDIVYSDVPLPRNSRTSQRASKRPKTPTGGEVRFVAEPLSPYFCHSPTTPVNAWGQDTQYIHVSVQPSPRGILGVILECNGTDGDAMKPDVCLGETQECNRDKLAVRGSVDETDAPLCGHALRTTSRVNEDGGVRVQRVMPGHVAWRGGELAAGDEIISISGRPVAQCRTVDDVQRVFAGANATAIATNSPIDIVVRRA